jgi:hypothetical protein
LAGNDRQRNEWMASKIIIAARKPIYRPGRGGREHAAKQVLACLRWVYDVMTISPPVGVQGHPYWALRIPTVPLADHGEINI